MIVRPTTAGQMPAEPNSRFLTQDDDDISGNDSVSNISQQLQIDQRSIFENTSSSCIQEEDYNQSLREVQAYLEKVKKIVRPGCSPQVLEAALGSLAELSKTLSLMLFTTKIHSPL